MISIIGAISNAIRGGQLDQWIPNLPKWVSGDVLNALFFAAAVLGLTSNPWLAAACFAGMWGGAAPGWGDYIGAVGGWRTGGLKEAPFIDPLIKWLLPWPRLWGLAGLTLRGLFWGACIAAPFAAFADYTHALAFLATGSTMGLVYLFTVEWCHRRLGDVQGLYQGTGWGMGELIFGAVLWSAL